MYACVCGGETASMCACVRDERLMLGVFLNYSPPLVYVSETGSLSEFGALQTS